MPRDDVAFYGGTTRIPGTAFGNPTRRELMSMKEPRGTRMVRPREAEEDVRGTGLLTHYRPTLGWSGEREERARLRGETLMREGLARGVQEEAELGEPTSFRGGAGAPTPQRTALTTQAGGPAYFTIPGVEGQFSSPLRAQQAWTRQQRGQFLVEHPTREGLTYPEGTSPEEQATARFGTYRAPGMGMLERRGELMRQAYAAETRAPERVEEAETRRVTRERALQAEEGKRFDEWLHGSQYAKFDPSQKRMTFAPVDENQARDQIAARNIAIAQGSDAGRQHFEDRQMLRRWLVTQPLPRDTNVNAILDDAMRNPEHWQRLVERATREIGVSRPATPGLERPAQLFEVPGFAP